MAVQSSGFLEVSSSYWLAAWLGCAGLCIRLEGATTTGNLVTGNRLSSLDAFAIYLLNGADANTVTNNTILRGTVEVDVSVGPGNVVGPN